MQVEQVPLSELYHLKVPPTTHTHTLRSSSAITFKYQDKSKSFPSSKVKDNLAPVKDPEDDQDKVKVQGVLGFRREVRLGPHDVDGSRLKQTGSQN